MGSVDLNVSLIGGNIHLYLSLLEQCFFPPPGCTAQLIQITNSSSRCDYLSQLWQKPKCAARGGSGLSWGIPDLANALIQSEYKSN